MRLLVIALLLGSLSATAQSAIQLLPSPAAVTTARYKDTYLKITYSQPHKRGRQIFGALVPYGQVWRTGANEATEITLTRDIQVRNEVLKAGTYSIFSIPEKDKWTIIFNSDVGLWGAYNYNPKNDVLRVEGSVETLVNNTLYEPFTISVETRNDKATLYLRWDQTSISVPLQFIEPKP